MATARHSKKGTVRKSNKRTRLLTVLFVLLFVFGAFLALYPFVSDLFVSKQQAQAIADYQSYINSLDRQIVDEQFEKAQQYNSQNNACYDNSTNNRPHPPRQRDQPHNYAYDTSNYSVYSHCCDQP